MAKDEITYKDLSNRQLDNLKEIYIESRLSSMEIEDLRKFVRSIISDQIKGTVGNQEEREAWKEMKDHFENDFEQVIKDVLKINSPSDESISPEQQELERRLELLEQRKQESSDSTEDMW
tara:strand:- start:194 stop:553 length:360 start_codon:yes stop_codon:yes gene_type:complete